ncbi:hypothetical protein F0358_01405 [Empedobacter brevis]|uniref:hypothetical protein n=1 Tax=Empedobacter brevis TaxID=247 RepID=UPI00123E1CA5|nr:hypothetical protein [Empedobacter brevis]QES91467.1 hypothetical protein F0358_01405 [Empedobacter brevis]QHC86511.1 hypothetical protein AS589_17870 [Empedobacter brevis]
MKNLLFGVFTLFAASFSFANEVPQLLDNPKTNSAEESKTEDVISDCAGMAAEFVEYVESLDNSLSSDELNNYYELAYYYCSQG